MSVTTYSAIATLNQGWWAVEIPDVGGGIWTQGRTVTEAEFMARDAIAMVLDISPDDVAVSLTVKDTEATLRSLAEARAARQRAAEREQAALTKAATDLLAMGMSQRDAARLLGLSHQRVSQLVRGAVTRRRAA